MFPQAHSRSFTQSCHAQGILKAIDMTDFIKTDFSSVPHVSDVEVSRNGRDFAVTVYLTNFDRPFRRKVYAKERAMYREFPQYSFDFNLVDASQQIDDVFGDGVSG